MSEKLPPSPPPKTTPPEQKTAADGQWETADLRTAWGRYEELLNTIFESDGQRVRLSTEECMARSGIDQEANRMLQRGMPEEKLKGAFDGMITDPKSPLKYFPRHTFDLVMKAHESGNGDGKKHEHSLQQAVSVPPATKPNGDVHLSSSTETGESNVIDGAASN